MLTLESVQKIFEKYNQSGPRYTSYPPAPHFHDGYDQASHIKQIQLSNEEGEKNISFYFHVPFCPETCYYCACTQENLQSKGYVERYMKALMAELKTVSSHLDKSRPVTQVHWGGGTPNSIPYRFIEEVMAYLKDNFVFSPGAEIAMECDPSLMNEKKIVQLREMGFTRLSYGIQDTSEDVLKLVNRRPSKLPVNELVSVTREAGYKGINLDFIYGLPGQNIESFRQVIETAIQAHPDRVVTFSYAHVPWIKEHQKILENIHIPTADEKVTMFINSYNQLVDAGYDVIGMDHYALPDDDLAVAVKTAQLHRNFQGYCTRQTTGQVYAIGASSISQLDNAYGQNIKSSAEYMNSIETGQLPVIRGYVLSDEEKFRREVINEIMCNGRLNYQVLAVNHSLEVSQVKQMLADGIEQLHEFESDSLLSIDDKGLQISNEGWLTVRNIAMVFDPLLAKGNARYSKTL